MIFVPFLFHMPQCQRSGVILLYLIPPSGQTVGFSLQGFVLDLANGKAGNMTADILVDANE